MAAILFSRAGLAGFLVVAIGLALVAIHHAGVSAERARQELAAAAAGLAEAERQRDAAAAALDELTRGSELDALERQRLNARIDAYVDRLNAAAAGDGCLDTGADVDSLRR